MINRERQEEILLEFRRVQGKRYLDHAGSTLYSERQIEEASELLKGNLLGNPHTIKVTEDLVDQVRYRILKHFNASPTDYDVVFTSGATAGLKLVAECFDFGKFGCFAYTQENHTSVLGMREVIGTEAVYVVQREELLENLNRPQSSELKAQSEGNSLVAFPAQCNFSGYKYPLDLIEKISQNGPLILGKLLRGERSENHKTTDWFTCLDAANFASTNLLDLGKYKPDFVCISFYKIFGYPTGIGALVVSKRGQNVMKKRYFGGGTVKIAMSAHDFHEKRDPFHQRFEDGTMSFSTIPLLLIGFNTIDRLIPSQNGLSSIEQISQHVFELAKYCYNSLKDLNYKNGKPVVKFYNCRDFRSVKEQGGLVTFNVLHDDGSYVGFAEIACIASIYNIILRTGCFCNSGACQVFLGLSDDEIRKQYEAGHICGDYNDLIDNKPTGAVRVSFGYMSIKADVDALIFMISDCYLKDVTKRLEIIESTEIPKTFQHIPNRLKRETNPTRLRQICIYPIKSCAAFKINDKWELTDKGFKFDRVWMIVNSNGVAATQKADPKLCLISPEIDINRNAMILRFPDKENIEVPLTSADQSSTFTLCQSKVCGDLVEGIDCGDAVATWLSDCLSTPGLRLIQQRDDIDRRSMNGKVRDITLANQAQFLLINYTSVKWLVSKIEDWEQSEENIEGVVDRFRGNLIIETNEPLEEMKYEEIRFGDVNFKVDGFCTRCQMICIDQHTGLKTAEPLRTIAKEFGGKIRFGIYLSQLNCERGGYISCSNQISINKSDRN